MPLVPKISPAVREEECLKAKAWLQHLADSCRQSDVEDAPAIGLIQSLLAETDDSMPPTALKLMGNEAPLREQRLDDTTLRVLITPLSSVPLFKKLELSYNKIGDDGVMELAQFLTEDKFLETIILKSNNIASDGGSALAHALTLNDHVKELDLSNNDIGKGGGMDLASMLQLNTTLRTLNLSGCSLTLDPLIALATVLRNNATITVLDLSDNASPTSSATQSLQNAFTSHWSRTLRVNSTLRELRLRKMGLTDWGVVDDFASAVGANKGLRVLDLSGNKITQDGSCKLFMELRQQPYLRSLFLSSCKIQDQGAEECRKMLMSNTVLKKLTIDNNGITSVGLKAIAQAFQQNTTLQSLKLWGNQWDSSACEVYNALQTSNGDKNSKPRFSASDLDVAFYTVSGVMHVAHQDSDK
ncbi:hypothetical protein SmJEL517_g05005 [Synchytrium microbalum]|uniref:Uncharacterized protein n=1 Tax=Synchytrium microbalum TaxID=1806994 RepID=A0A507C102_9FUNG|nr:uncharacterized protein SmJEL517_g05005 [Synchytrium microbalum]TPX31734.1 hypothetical protein SmJEL517_g05005 [Synchytrium microbalum]